VRRVGKRSAVGLALIAVAAVLVALRLPHALDQLDGRAAAEIGRNDEGGALAAADMVGIKDDFVRAAIHILPRNARFAALVADPEQAHKTYGVSTTTILAVHDLMQEILLPRRATATAGRGMYVLCYYCDTAPWDHRTRWLWRGGQGDLIGLVYR
jgi:hypothetical protein